MLFLAHLFPSHLFFIPSFGCHHFSAKSPSVNFNSLQIRKYEEEKKLNLLPSLRFQQLRCYAVMSSVFQPLAAQQQQQQQRSYYFTKICF